MGIADDAIAHRLVVLGHSVDEIATELGIGRSTIYRRLKSEPLRAKVAEQRARVKKLRQPKSKATPSPPQGELIEDIDEEGSRRLKLVLTHDAGLQPEPEPYRPNPQNERRQRSQGGSRLLGVFALPSPYSMSEGDYEMGGTAFERSEPPADWLEARENRIALTDGAGRRMVVGLEDAARMIGQGWHRG